MFLIITNQHHIHIDDENRKDTIIQIYALCSDSVIYVNIKKANFEYILDVNKFKIN